MRESLDNPPELGVAGSRVIHAALVDGKNRFALFKLQPEEARERVLKVIQTFPGDSRVRAADGNRRQGGRGALLLGTFAYTSLGGAGVVGWRRRRLALHLRVAEPMERADFSGNRWTTAKGSRMSGNQAGVMRRDIQDFRGEIFVVTTPVRSLWSGITSAAAMGIAAAGA